jgi:hypothetical protein
MHLPKRGHQLIYLFVANYYSIVCKEEVKSVAIFFTGNDHGESSPALPL